MVNFGHYDTAIDTLDQFSNCFSNQNNKKKKNLNLKLQVHLKYENKTTTKIIKMK